MRRAAAPSGVERPLAAPLVALPDGAANGGGDGLARALTPRRRGLGEDERERWRGLLRRLGRAAILQGHGDALRLHGACRHDERGPRRLHLPPRLRLLFQQEIQRRLQHLLHGRSGDGVREASPGRLELLQELPADVDMDAAPLCGERLDLVALGHGPTDSPKFHFGRPKLRKWDHIWVLHGRSR